MISPFWPVTRRSFALSLLIAPLAFPGCGGDGVGARLEGRGEATSEGRGTPEEGGPETRKSREKGARADTGPLGAVGVNGVGQSQS